MSATRLSVEEEDYVRLKAADRYLAGLSAWSSGDISSISLGGAVGVLSESTDPELLNREIAVRMIRLDIPRRFSQFSDFNTEHRSPGTADEPIMEFAEHGLANFEEPVLDIDSRLMPPSFEQRKIKVKMRLLKGKEEPRIGFDPERE